MTRPGVFDDPGCIRHEDMAERYKRRRKAA